MQCFNWLLREASGFLKRIIAYLKERASFAMHPLFIIFIVAGSGLTLMDLWLVRRVRAFRRKVLSTQGRYVDVTWSTSSINRRTAYLVIEFQSSACELCSHTRCHFA